AVDRLDLTLPDGCICGLVGANGSGKSTTLQMLSGVTRPTSGSATVLSLDIERQSVELRRQVALVPQGKGLYSRLEADRFLRYYASFFPEADPTAGARLLQRWGVPADQPIGALSHGSRAKVLLAAAMSRRPRLWLLDEPTEGLDPEAQEGDGRYDRGDRRRWRRRRGAGHAPAGGSGAGV
ncbi:MAG: ABC transporter ATP-binding protein, partial [Sporichthyaceae bacterium]|nr:ABC transporter ATP-binding protein [Sporichthyaceae bacterium]